MSQPEIDVIVKVLDDMRKEAAQTALAATSSAGVWGRMVYVLGVPAAGLAGTSGVLTAVNKNDALRLVGAALAVLAAFVTGVATSLNAPRRAQETKNLANQCQAFIREVEVVRDIDLPRAMRRLDELTAETEDAGSGSTAEVLGLTNKVYDEARAALQVLRERWEFINGVPSEPPAFRQNASDPTARPPRTDSGSGAARRRGVAGRR